jgi:hypothetical protein
VKSVEDVIIGKAKHLWKDIGSTRLSNPELSEKARELHVRLAEDGHVVSFPFVMSVLCLEYWTETG